MKPVNWLTISNWENAKATPNIGEKGKSKGEHALASYAKKPLLSNDTQIPECNS